MRASGGSFGIITEFLYKVINHFALWNKFCQYSPCSSIVIRWGKVDENNKYPGIGCINPICYFLNLS
jgi:hypothetical protein